MLIELRIENLAVIERLQLRLEPGLNVLTGETGAGKSILVGALSLLLGERASAESVRAGAQRAVIEGVFDASGLPALHALLRDRGIEVEDGLVILRREIAAEGRSRAWINGAASTASFIGEVGRHLVDLHGQHEHQSLLTAAEQRDILDAYGGCADTAQAVQAAYRRTRKLEAQLDALQTRQREIAERADLLRHQLAEIEKAKLRPDEEAELQAEAHRLSHAEELARLAARLHHELYAAEEAVVSRLDALRRVMSQLVKLDPARQDAERSLGDAFFALQELGREMGEYAARVEGDPARLEQIRARLDLLYRLKSRYGGTIGAVLEAGERTRAELATLDNAAVETESLRKLLAQAREEHLRLTRKLTEKRRKAATRLDREINAALPALGMTGGRFATALTPLPQPGAHGAEAIEFRVTVNAGFEPAPLARVASGGELSRIMLALKATLAAQDRVPTLVFDEIDAGIGGRAAHHVGERLRAVAEAHQVFVVTHLAQVASRADHHFLVDKTTSGGMTSATVSELQGQDRVRELARLLGGDPESRISQAHARELLGSVSD